MKRYLHSLTTLLLVAIFLAPGWFPVSVLGVEGTDLIRADHGCACGKLTGCCCEIFAPKNRNAESGAACQLRSRQGYEPSRAATGHDGHGTHHGHSTHHGHGEHAEASRITEESGAGSDAGRFCVLPTDLGDAPAERAATLDFRTLVGPLLTATPGPALGPSEFLNGTPAASPDLLPEVPETPPPQSFVHPA